MEETYPPDGFEGASQLFKLQEYFDEYTKFLSETLYKKQDELQFMKDTNKKIACLMDITNDECAELEELCSLSLLDSNPTKGRLKGLSKLNNDKNPEDLLLEKATRTLVTAVEFKALKSQPLKHANKLRELKKHLVPNFLTTPSPSSLMKIPDKFVVVARVYRPFNSYSGSNMAVSHGQDFLLLSSQSLASFRDKITCLNDEVVVGDSISSDDPEGVKVPMKRLLTSGMFYFGDTLYCDNRDLMCKNYGEVIDRWAKENPQMKLGPFKQTPMESATVADLEIRFGYPYVFMHLGSCEHLITFIEARIMSPEDEQDVSKYPLVVETENSLMYCCACDTYATSWVVEDDAMPTKPANLCKQCFEVFYTRNGQVVPPHFCCLLPSAKEGTTSEATN